METEHKLLRLKEKQLISNMAILPIVKSGQQQIQKKPGYCWPSWDERAHGKLVNRIWQCLSKCLLLDAGCYKPCSFRSIYGDFFQMKVNNFWNPAYSFFKPLWIFMVKNWYRAGISCTFIVPLQRQEVWLSEVRLCMEWPGYRMRYVYPSFIGIVLILFFLLEWMFTWPLNADTWLTRTLPR